MAGGRKPRERETRGGGGGRRRCLAETAASPTAGVVAARCSLCRQRAPTLDRPQAAATAARLVAAPEFACGRRPAVRGAASRACSLACTRDCSRALTFTRTTD